jgi:ATP-dependent phosphoenolpyruvate carboxykinase
MLKIVPWSFGWLAVEINLSILASENYGLEIKELLAMHCSRKAYQAMTYSLRTRATQALKVNEVV